MKLRFKAKLGLKIWLMVSLVESELLKQKLGIQFKVIGIGRWLTRTQFELRNNLFNYNSI